MKKEPTNKLRQAWSSFFKETAVGDLEAYRSEGWKTINDIALQSKKPISTIHSRIRRGGNFEWKTITALDSRGVARRITVARPKLKG
jgi:hypothetical protein